MIETIRKNSSCIVTNIQAEFFFRSIETSPKLPIEPEETRCARVSQAKRILIGKRCISVRKVLLEIGSYSKNNILVEMILPGYNNREKVGNKYGAGH